MAAKSDNHYEKFFAEADADNDGYLTLDELTDILRRRGYKDSDTKIRSMFTSVDTSGDNKISLDEYKTAMGLMSPQQHKAAMLRSVFRSFDLNGDGTIDRNELDEVFKSMGHALTPDNIDRIMQMTDKDGNGTLNYEEFMQEVFGAH